MNSNKDPFESFLRKNRPAAPAAPAWEKQKIWREIETRGLVTQRAQRTLRLPRWAAAMTAVVLLVVVVAGYRHHQRETEINQILYQIMKGEIQDKASEGMLF